MTLPHPHDDGPLRALRRWTVFAGLLAAVLASGAGLAHAADNDDPEKLIKRGNDLRRQGDNVRAFGYLQRAHEVAGTPRTAAQLGLCEQALGRFADAETHLTAALSTNDAWVDANRAGLESSRGVVRQKLGKVQITGAPPNTTVTIGATPSRRLPADGAVWVAPGAVTLTLEAPGFRTATRTSTVAEGGTATVAAGLVAVIATTTVATSGSTPSGTTAGTASSGPATATAKDPDPTSPGQASSGDSTPTVVEQAGGGNAALRITGLAVAGSGVALVVGGFVLRHMSSNKLAAIQSDAAAGRPYNPDNGNYKTLDSSGIALLVVGGAAVVTGAVLYVMNRDSDAPSPATARLDGRSLASRLSVAWTPDQGVRFGYATAF